MGMSATQARYLSLTAQQSDLEYQGQQINESRTTLSNQTNNLYTQLQDLSVPTPPSTTDYTTVQYSGTNGTITYTFDASSVKPGADGKYSLNLSYTDYGNSLNKNNGSKITKMGSETIKCTQLSTTYTTARTGYEEDDSETPQGYLVKQSSKPTEGDYYIVDSDGKYVKGGSEDETYTGGYYVYQDAKPEEGTDSIAVKGFSEQQGASKTFTSDELSEIYTEDGKVCTSVEGAYTDLGDGKYSLNSTMTFYKKDSNGQTELTVPDGSGYTIAGKNAYTLDKAGFTDDQLQGYAEAIKNSGLKKTDGSAYTTEDFYVYFDDDQQPHFALKTDVQRATAKKDNTCVTYDYLMNGSFTNNEPYDKCGITFDPSTGRITSIDIPSSYDDDGNPLSYTTIDISSESVTDESAYKDAYAEYEYKKYQYDQEQTKINAEMSIIQQEDKSLELKLERLDNERTQITTEIEALDKVINDNIEKSYKTFSG